MPVRPTTSEPSLRTDETELAPPVRDPATPKPKAGERATRLDRRLGKYNIIAELGRGGMADVYLAVTRGPSDFSKLLVLKTMRDGLAGADGFLEMFFEEARLSARLNHPNIVQVYEVGTIEGRHVIVMEYLPGRSLGQIRRRARNRGIDVRDASISMLAQALSGLHHAHELEDYDGTPLQLVHRDFTPNNVLVTYAGHAKVLDFGIAKATNVSSQTATGVVKGTVRYLAPEAVEEEPLDRRADIYAAGVILWEAIAGERMWAQASDFAVMRKLAAGDVPSIREAAPDAPEALLVACERAMSPDREARHATALELLEDLESYLGTVSPQPSTRSITALMEELFAEEREKFRATIDKELAGFGNDGNSIPPPSPVPTFERTPSRTSTRTRPAGATDSDRPTVVERPPQDPAGRRGPRTWLWAAGSVAALGAGALFMLSPSSPGAHDGSPAGDPPLAGAPEAQRTEAPDEDIEAPSPDERPAPVNAIDVPPVHRVRVLASPESAHISFDDVPMEGNPAELQRAGDNALHRIRVEAPGFQTREVEVRLDRDVELRVDLRRERRTRVRQPTPAQGTPDMSTMTPSMRRRLDVEDPFAL